MLQIASGKLFTRPVGLKNFMRGILYTNACLGVDEIIPTTAGNLVQSSACFSLPNVLIYEFTEHMEAQEVAPGVIQSHGIEPYLEDYSVLVSFALNCICSPDIDTVKRLISDRPGIATKIAPNKLVNQFFDKNYWCTSNELKFLQTFVDKIIKLPRQTFICVMRTLRAYVNGMHRIADDLELAYTLLVASVESLAQDFDAYENNWESFDQRKRRAIDEALSGADEETANRVRETLLRIEHVALAHRFKGFVLKYVPQKFFRQTTDNGGLCMAKSYLIEVVDRAYQIRSKYVHQLRQLPDIMSALPDNCSGTIMSGRHTYLTLQGLSRLLRSVIIEFIMTQPSVDHEPYNYYPERSGIIQMPMSPEYWVGRADGDITKRGRDKLEGFLSQLASCMLRHEKSVLTDLSAVLNAANNFVQTIEKRLRSPYLVLYVMFNNVVSNDRKIEVPPAIALLIEQELCEQCSEALIVHAFLRKEIAWELEDHYSIFDNYFRQRPHKNGLRFPYLFEAAITLELAERYRKTGDMERCRKLIACAVDNYPGLSGLLEFESKVKFDTPIDWRSILLPQNGN